MLRKTTLLLSLLAFLSCHKAQKSTDIYWKGKIDGATVKAVVINNMEFNVGEPESTFDTTFRFIAKDLGTAILPVNIYIGSKDHTILGTTITGSDALLQTLLPEDLYIGPDLYPQLDLRFTFAEIAELLRMEVNDVQCKDQFLLRFELSTDTGLTLSANSASPCIMGKDSFIDSPFEYAINVVEPIPDDSFVGAYYYESIVDGAFGVTLGDDGVVILSKGHSNNTRRVGVGPIYFTVACDGSIMGRHFFQPGVNFCRTLGNAAILGPDDAIAPIDAFDGSVVDLWMVEGYLGFDAGLGFGTLSTEVRFSKQ